MRITVTVNARGSAFVERPAAEVARVLVDAARQIASTSGRTASEIHQDLNCLALYDRAGKLCGLVEVQS